MAGINRLGKGSAKPGTLRPADPNRFKTEDFFSVDAEQDPEYLRRIVEVEQLAVNKTGSVLAKGAFDKNDALFMRDEAEKARHRELEQRDAELAQFSRMRAKLDQEAALEMMDPGPMPKRTKIAKPKAVMKKTGEKVGTQPDEARASLRRSIQDAAEVTGAGQTDTRGTYATQAGLNSRTKVAAAGMLPGAEVAEIVTSTNVISGKIDVAAAATLDKYATESARSGCLGLQYDSDDGSEDQSE